MKQPQHLKRKKLFEVELTSHSIDPDSGGYRSWEDKKRVSKFTFVADSFEDALTICRQEGMLVDLSDHRYECVFTNAVTIESLVYKGHVCVNPNQP